MKKGPLGILAAVARHRLGPDRASADRDAAVIAWPRCCFRSALLALLVTPRRDEPGPPAPPRRAPAARPRGVVRARTAARPGHHGRLRGAPGPARGHVPGIRLAAVLVAGRALPVLLDHRAGAGRRSPCCWRSAWVPWCACWRAASWPRRTRCSRRASRRSRAAPTHAPSTCWSGRRERYPGRPRPGVPAGRAVPQGREERRGGRGLRRAAAQPAGRPDRRSTTSRTSPSRRASSRRRSPRYQQGLASAPTPAIGGDALLQHVARVPAEVRSAAGQRGALAGDPSRPGA